ncbi:Adrenodoxin-like protein 1, mitochondrial [Porphyridium purpureum]|uniref:2Fe-2S ferredoxin n=1 Tax=Porphyridium purpureum TaxID=35688 RepID=A0A5J4YXL2_PORPP|nr:Adrenodoxin-like protein 1, mitochondrial [Porphyridium purpureum]|eukprot:POR9633..scf209_3
MRASALLRPLGNSCRLPWGRTWAAPLAPASNLASNHTRTWRRAHGNEPYDESRAITVYFIDRDQRRIEVKAPLGANMLQVAHRNDIDLEGACEGSLACSTCHVYVDDKNFTKLKEPCDDENDMLDLAFGLKENSRLGCQIIATPELDGMELRLPSATRNMAVDGHVPKPH